jgi:hypothetical protein
MFEETHICPNTGGKAVVESKGAMTGDPSVCSECGYTLHTESAFQHGFRSHTVATRIPVPITKIVVTAYSQGGLAIY